MCAQISAKGTRRLLTAVYSGRLEAAHLTAEFSGTSLRITGLGWELAKVKILRYAPDLLNQTLWGRVWGNVPFNTFPGWFLYTLR